MFSLNVLPLLKASASDIPIDQFVQCLVQLVKGKFLYSAVSKRFTLYSLADLLNRTPSRLLREAFSNAAINSQRLLVHMYSPLSVSRSSFIQLSELDQCKVKKFVQGFTRKHRFKSGSFSRESDVLPMSHCATAS